MIHYLTIPIVLWMLSPWLSQSIGIPIRTHKLEGRNVANYHARPIIASRGLGAQGAICHPMTESFDTLTLPSTWVSLSTNSQSYRMNPNGGVDLVLNAPVGPVTVSQDGKTNDKLGDGSTINSTYSLLYGKVSITLSATTTPGSVTALVLLGTATMDEIDVEILGGDPIHWQTNVFRPAPGETEPLYGIFGGVQSYPSAGTTETTHTYVIDWSPERIIWSVDGTKARTLTPAQTLHNGQQHYPSALSRIQLGLWDASSPVGTSTWAHGPIPWSGRQKQPVTATIKSVQVECPY